MNRDGTTTGSRLRQARLDRGLSLRRVARDLDITPMRLSRWERNLKRAPDQWKLAVAAYYGVSVLDLWPGLVDERIAALRAIMPGGTLIAGNVSEQDTERVAV